MVVTTNGGMATIGVVGRILEGLIVAQSQRLLGVRIDLIFSASVQTIAVGTNGGTGVIGAVGKI